MKIIEVSRSYSRTIQYKQFEPISSFASYKAELTGEESKEDVEKISNELFRLSYLDVERSLTATKQKLTEQEPAF